MSNKHYGEVQIQCYWNCISGRLVKTKILGICFTLFIISRIVCADATPTPNVTIIPTPTVTVTITPQAPSVTTLKATIEDCQVTLHGIVNPNGLLTTTWFEYGTASSTYNGTSSTKTLAGMENTTVSMEIDKSFYFAVYNWCTNETTYSGSRHYYYRIAAQNSAGISYGGEERQENCTVAGDVFDCTPTPVVTLSPTQTPDNSGSVSGYVTNVRGKPIKSVKLKLKEKKTKHVQTASSDEEGLFAFTNLDAGTYLMSAKKKGYDKLIKQIKLEEGEEKEITITMSKKVRK